MPAPKYCDTMMLAPTEIPMNSTSIRFSSGPALPTAARALSPTKRDRMPGPHIYSLKQFHESVSSL